MKGALSCEMLTETYLATYKTLPEMSQYDIIRFQKLESVIIDIHTHSPPLHIPNPGQTTPF